MHESVLLKEVVHHLDPHPGGFHVDGTMDGGGHALAILKHIVQSGMLLGVDWDEQVLERGAKRISEELGVTEEELAKHFIRVRGNYSDLPEILQAYDLPKPDGLVLDLGFSSEQLESERGFSFLKDEPLLMTYSEQTEPAYRVLQRLSENQLATIIRDLGGERYAKRVATAIREAEKKSVIRTSGKLAEIVRKVLPKGYERGRIDPATRTFQAIRIFVNHELENLEKILKALGDMMAPNGRVVIISFHSLEDALVKKYFREFDKSGRAELLTTKPIEAKAEEIARNPRSRSAKLRAIKFK